LTATVVIMGRPVRVEGRPVADPPFLQGTPTMNGTRLDRLERSHIRVLNNDGGPGNLKTVELS
jgi:hypothetical protein